MQKINTNDNFFLSLTLPTSFSMLKIKLNFPLIPSKYPTIEPYHPASNFYFLKLF